MKIQQLDHLVLTVSNIQLSIDFYTRALGMQLITFGDDRKALKFGHQKINLHPAGHEFKPHAKKPTCGSADLCFIVETALEEISEELNRLNIPIEMGPVRRTGSTSPLTSIYIRDPDNNLIELSVPT